MLLQGSLREFNLPNILQLVKMSASTGALLLSRGDAHGRIYFSKGSICYASIAPQSVPIGQRFVNARHITPAQLREASVRQQESSGSSRLGVVLVDMGLIDQGTLDTVVCEQIQDTVFDFFGWPNGEFEFNDDEVAAEQDIFVEMQVENVIMESCRRIDELEFILEQLGSLESVPHLAHGSCVDNLGEVTFTAEEWSCAVHADGRTDINTILLDCGFDRFHGAKIMRTLYERGLIKIAAPAMWSIDEGVSVAVRGPVDIYNEILVNTLTDADVVKQLRVEIIDESEVEIPIVAGRVQMGDGDAAGQVFVFAVSSAAPESAVRRLAGKSSAWVLLADARDTDSVRALRPDIDFVTGLGDAPIVVAAYAPVARGGLSPQQVAEALDLGADMPVVPCGLRDRDSVLGVAQAAVRQVTGREAALSGQSAS